MIPSGMEGSQKMTACYGLLFRVPEDFFGYVGGTKSILKYFVSFQRFLFFIFLTHNASLGQCELQQVFGVLRYVQRRV